MAYSNTVRYIPLSIAVFIVVSKAHQICNSTSECPAKYFCDFIHSNNSESRPPECKPCITCTDYNRQSINKCTEEIQQCGPCQAGFTFTSESVTNCVAIDDQKGKCNDCELAPVNLSKITTTDIVVVFALILPVSAVIVIGMTLLIGYVYRKQIQKKSLKDNYTYSVIA